MSDTISKKIKDVKTLDILLGASSNEKKEEVVLRRNRGRKSKIVFEESNKTRDGIDYFLEKKFSISRVESIYNRKKVRVI